MPTYIIKDDISTDKTETLRMHDATYLTANNATAADTIEASDMYVGQYKKAGVYYIERLFPIIVTSVIPPTEEVIGVKIRLYCEEKRCDEDFDLVVQHGMPTYPHDPVVLDDYDETLYSGDLSEVLNTADIIEDAWFEIDLTEEAYQLINKNGLTKFVIRSKREIDEVVPTANEYIMISAPNDTDYEPQLIITTRESIVVPGVELKMEFGTRTGVMLSKSYYDKSVSHHSPVIRKGSPISPPCDIVDRLMARIPEAYYKETDGNIYGVETIEASQLCLIRDMAESVRNSHWVDYAAGPALENMGKLLGVTRRDGESDSTLRARIIATIPTLAGGGTIPMLQQVLAPVFGVDEEDIVVGDGYLAGDNLGDNAFLLKLDGDTTDWEGNHNADNYGGSYSTGRFGQGITVSPYCFLNIATHSDFNTPSFTVYAWVKLTSAGNGVIIQRVNRFPTPGTPEWWFGVSGGVLRGYTYLSDSTSITVNATTGLKIGKWYLVGMTFNDTDKTLTLFQVEDGKRGRMYRMSLFTGSCSKSRYFGGNALLIGGTEDLTDQFPGVLDHIGYRKHAMVEPEMAEMAYCAPGLDHYAHFNITVVGDVSSITAEQWDFAEVVVSKYKAAGTVFDGFGNKLTHSIGISTDGMYWHYTDCSKTDSLNKVKL